MSTNNPLATVNHYIDAFNKGDADAMAETFAASGSILDGMPPHVWAGPSASRDWYRDVLIDGKQHGASEYFVTLGEPTALQRHGRERLCSRARYHDLQIAGPTG